MRIELSTKTIDGLSLYDLDLYASELWMVAGPAGVDPYSIDTDNLPDGFRWVDEAEWANIQAASLRRRRRNPPRNQQPQRRNL